MIYIALPVLNESKELPELLKVIKSQDVKELLMVVCVNQYEHWWEDENHRAWCEDNQQSLQILKSEKELPIKIIDKSSKGNGWLRKKGGVGHARKVIMDWISDHAEEDDIIVSIDADTFYPVGYLSTMQRFFEQNKESWGVAVPYYHKLTGNEIQDKLILRYEIYMRCFLLNMIRINSPYAFTAIGSAMSFPVWAYRKAGGLTPVLSGEDFYFLQKLTKYGSVDLYIPTTAFPSSRFSERVVFGTGPALIRGNKGDWSGYPIYAPRFFDEVGKTFELFSELFLTNVPTPMDDFLKKQFRSSNIWNALRKNYKDKRNFVRACQNKIDGLRVLQYLRFRQSEENVSDEEALKECLERENLFNENKKCLVEIIENGLENASLDCFQTIRNSLFRKEMVERRQVSLKTNPIKN